MLKKTVSYTDTDGVPCTEDFYFNLTRFEILELQVSRVGGFAQAMELLAKSTDQQRILSTIKELVLLAYGERTDISRHFVKRPEFAEAFSHTEAFSNLVMDMFTDTDKANAFFEGLMPADLMEQVRQEQASKEQNPLVTPRPRLIPQDHQKKHEAEKPAFEVVKDVEIPIMTETPSDTLSLSEFSQLPSDQAQAFINGGGRVV